MNTRLAVDSYSKVHYNANVEVASPHRLIEMLFEGALQSITQAKGAMEYGNVEIKGKKINKAIAIVGGLRESLNMEEGTDIAENLNALYIYIQEILFQAHIKNNPDLLDESSQLLNQLASAWKQIGPAE